MNLQQAPQCFGTQDNASVRCQRSSISLKHQPKIKAPLSTRVPQLKHRRHLGGCSLGTLLPAASLGSHQPEAAAPQPPLLLSGNASSTGAVYRRAPAPRATEGLGQPLAMGQPPALGSPLAPRVSPTPPRAWGQPLLSPAPRLGAGGSGPAGSRPRGALPAGAAVRRGSARLPPTSRPGRAAGPSPAAIRPRCSGPAAPPSAAPLPGPLRPAPAEPKPSRAAAASGRPAPPGPYQAQVPGSVHHHGQVLPRRRHAAAGLSAAPGSKGRQDLPPRGRPSAPPAALRAKAGAAPHCTEVTGPAPDPGPRSQLQGAGPRLRPWPQTPAAGPRPQPQAPAAGLRPQPQAPGPGLAGPPAQGTQSPAGHSVGPPQPPWHSQRLGSSFSWGPTGCPPCTPTRRGLSRDVAIPVFQSITGCHQAPPTLMSSTQVHAASGLNGVAWFILMLV